MHPPRAIATMVLKMESCREKKRMNEHKGLEMHCKDKYSHVKLHGSH